MYIFTKSLSFINNNNTKQKHTHTKLTVKHTEHITLETIHYYTQDTLHWRQFIIIHMVRKEE